MSRATLTSEQMEMLICELEKRPHLVKGRLEGNITKNSLKDGWKEITEKVNSISNGRNVNCEALKKRWSQWRSRVKSKAALIRKEINKTGGDKRYTPPLTDVEERVASLIGNEEFGMDSPNLFELGTHIPTEQIQYEHCERENIDSTVCLELPNENETTTSHSYEQTVNNLFPDRATQLEETTQVEEPHSRVQRGRRRTSRLINHNNDVLNSLVAKSISNQAALMTKLESIEHHFANSIQLQKEHNDLLKQQNTLNVIKNTILVNILECMRQNTFHA